jgi:hypothetical protein
VQAYDSVANNEVLDFFKVGFKNNPQGLLQASWG